ncbi:MAG: SlyX family protein [Desulfopila sp.]
MVANDIRDRLRILEEKYEYQDDTVETLNQVIIGQQAQIARLEEELDSLRQALIAMGADIVSANGPVPRA